MGLLDIFKPRRTYPIKLIIFSERASGGYSVEFDGARRQLNNDGTEIYVTKKSPHRIPPVAYKQLSSNNVLVLKKTEAGRLAPMKVNIRDGNIKGVDADVSNWAINSAQKRLRQWQHPSFFNKYGNFIMTAGSLMVIGILIFITLDKILELQQIGAGATAALAEAINEVKLLLGTC
jgi:hypothetical protein